MLQMRKRSGQCGPPEPVRSVLKATGLFDYEGELDMAVEQEGQLPVIEITPISGAIRPKLAVSTRIRAGEHPTTLTLRGVTNLP